MNEAPDHDETPEPVTVEIRGTANTLIEEPSALELFDLYDGLTVKPGDLVEATLGPVRGDARAVTAGDAEGEVAAVEVADLADGAQVTLYAEDYENGRYLFSRGKAERLALWESLRAANAEGTPVEAIGLALTRDGLAVDIGVKALLPANQSGGGLKGGLGSLVGERFPVRVIKVNERKGLFTVSRRAVIEPELAARRVETLDTLKVGDVVSGLVKSVTHFGAFVDVGGLDGLLHVSDLSWGRVRHPSEVVEAGDEIAVKVIAFDREEGKLKLSRKEAIPSPWASILERMQVGDRVKARVVGFTQYGAFAEVEPGVEGLLHVSELSWTRRINHPKEVLRVGQEVEAEIVNLSPPNQRMRLSLKRLTENPWAAAAEAFPAGTIITGPVRSVTDFGVFIQIAEGVDGLVHSTDLSWRPLPGRISERYRVGDELQAMVLDIDVERERASLGLKQLTEDDSADVYAQLIPGEVVRGVVTHLAAFGAFVRLPGDIEGLIHVSELSDPPPARPEDAVKPGDELDVQILSVDAKANRVALSRKAALPAVGPDDTAPKDTEPKDTEPKDTEDTEPTDPAARPEEP